MNVFIDVSAPGGGSTHLRMWHFNGANNDTTTVDSSPANDTIVLQSTAKLSTAQVKFGSTALDLTGASNPFAIGQIPSINMRTQSWTIQGWFRPNASGNNAFFEFYNPTGTVRVLYLLQIGGTVFLGDALINPIASSRSFTAATWVHVLVSFDGTTYRIFFDGVLFQSTTTLMKSAAATEVRIGGDPEQGVYFPGYIDDVAWDDSALFTSNFTPPSAELP